MYIQCGCGTCMFSDVAAKLLSIVHACVLSIAITGIDLMMYL